MTLFVNLPRLPQYILAMGIPSSNVNSQIKIHSIHFDEQWLSNHLLEDLKLLDRKVMIVCLIYFSVNSLKVSLSYAFLLTTI